MNESNEKSGNNKTHTIKDNRKYPRVEQDGDVALVLGSDELIQTVMQDVSMDGMQIRFGNDTALALKPLIDLISDSTISEIEVRFALLIQGQKQQIMAKCKPIYIMKVDQGLFGMGLQYSVMDDKHSGYIKEFIEKSLEPM